MERCTGRARDFWRNSSQKAQKSELDLGHSLAYLTRKCWQCLEKPRSPPVPKELPVWQGRQTREHMRDVLCKECHRVPEKTSYLNMKTTKELKLAGLVSVFTVFPLEHQRLSGPHLCQLISADCWDHLVFPDKTKPELNSNCTAGQQCKHCKNKEKAEFQN